MITLANTIFEGCRSIKDGRNKIDVIAYVKEEFEELQDEVMMAEVNGKPGPDGIVGEAIDLMINTIDMILLEHPEITEAQLIAIAKRKIAKWNDLSKAKLEDQAVS